MIGPPLKNARQEKFAALVASGMAAGPAYAKAGYTSRTANARDKGASTLLRDSKVSGRVEELKLAITMQTVRASGLSKADVLEMVMEQHLRNTGKLMVTHRIQQKRGKQKGKISEITVTEYDAKAASQTAKMLMEEWGLGQGASGARGEGGDTIDARAKLEDPSIQQDLENLSKVRGMVLIESGLAEAPPAPAKKAPLDPVEAAARLKKLAGG